MHVAHIIVQFSIVCRIRNCEKIDRQELTKNIAAVVGKEHPVDLVNPELVIIIEVIQVCVYNAEIPALVIF
jgi:tRNA acetyltransferase TAN1